MASQLTQVLCPLFFLSIIINFPAPATPQACPYPCYPPPTGTGTTTPSTTFTPPSLPGYYNPPPAYFNPPSGGGGYLPYSPPYLGNAPPPPNAIVPWFPYYFRNPPNQADQSSAPALRGSSAAVAIVHFLGLLFWFSL